MRLLDVRKLAIKQGVRLRFRLSGGVECLIDEHGISRIPQLQAAPAFNLEEEFAKAGSFVLEPAAPALGKKKESTTARNVTREELQTMLGSSQVAPEEGHEE